MNWSSAEATKVVGAGGQALWGEGEGGELAQPAEGEALGGPNSSLPVLTRRSSGKWSQTHHSGVWQRMRDNRHVLKWEVQTGYKQNLLPHKDNHTWEQVAQRSCRLHPWRFLKPDWIMPWATWSGLTDDPGLSRTRGWTRDLQHSFQPELFYDPMNSCMFVPIHTWCKKQTCFQKAEFF